MTKRTYRAAGVDIDAGNSLVEAIKPLAASTARKGMLGGLGGFGAVFDLKAAGYVDPLLVSTTDGVGTKLKVALAAQRHDTVGIDLVAMCVNDLIVQGAEPLFFLDYYAVGRLDPTIGRDIVAGIAEGCRQAGCGLVGGETAEMPGLYAEGDYDLAGFSVGAVERGALLDGSQVKPGDRLLGLASSGLHSNGFSLVRKVVADLELDYAAPAPFSPELSLVEALLEPTRIYVNSCLQAIRHGGVHAMAHITGGGLPENMPRVLPEGLAANVDASAWQRPPVFEWLAKAGEVPVDDLYRTFNAGVGMVLVVDPDAEAALITLLQQAGETVFRIGEIERSGSSAFRLEGLAS